MNGQAHLVIGASVAGCVLGAMHAAGVPLETGQVVAGLGCGIVGGLAPDIDHPMATISFRIPLVVLGASISVLLTDWIIANEIGGGGAISDALTPAIAAAVAPFITLAWLGVALGVSLILLSILASAVFRHRGITHSIGAALLVTVVASVAAALYGTWWFGLLFGGGYLSHLAADLTGRTGLPRLLWPFDRLSVDPQGSVRPVTSRAPQPVVAQSSSVMPVQPQPASEPASSVSETKPEAVESARLCPRCGKQLVLRTPRATQTWKPFRGCAGYPKCRYTEACDG